MKTIIKKYLHRPALAVLLGGVFITPVARATETEIWISPNGPAATSGVTATPNNPYRCPTGADLHTVLTGLGDHTSIHLMAGTFEVSTNIVVKFYWKIRGAGIDNTILKLKANVVASNSGMDIITPFSGGGCNNFDGVEVSDLTVDCNAQNQSAANIVVNAVHLSGSDTKISRVKTINWGTTWAGSECFPLFIAGCGSGVFTTNCVIEDCIVTSPAPVYWADGVTCIDIAADVVSGAVIGGIARNNVVKNIPSNGGGNPIFVNAFGGYGTIIHNQVINLPNGRGVYNDSAQIRDLVIRANVFDNVSNPIGFSEDGGDTEGLVVKDNVIRVAENGNAISYNSGSHSISNFVIQGNVSYGKPAVTNAGALFLNGKTNIVSVVNNVMTAKGSNSAEIAFNDYNRDNIKNWFGNVNFMGLEWIETGDVYYWQPGNEDTIEFKPTTAGWYRIITGADTGLAGTIEVASAYQQTPETDNVFWFNTSWNNNPSNFGVQGVVRHGSFPGTWAGYVTKSRIVTDYPWCYLDIYIPDVTAGTTLHVTAKGPKRGQLANPRTSSPPALITTTPTYYSELTL